MSLPLMFILGVAAIKDILEDMDKHKADNIQNGRLVDVLNPATQKWEVKKWSTLRCGNLVRIKNREFVPADIVLVGSSDQINNGVFINTKSLDGETDLKIREVPDALIKTYEDDAVYASKIAGTITCELPTKVLTKFEGAYAPSDGSAKTPVTLSNVILRGCQVKQTAFAIGVRYFVGLYLEGKKEQTKR
jgi:phospholipid-transporting ATPase